MWAHSGEVMAVLDVGDGVFEVLYLQQATPTLVAMTLIRLAFPLD
jgi:hypothetical protein